MAEVRHLRDRRPVNNGSEPPADRAFEQTGGIMEALTDLECTVADLDDDELSAAVFLVRLKLTVVGNILARRRAVA